MNHAELLNLLRTKVQELNDERGQGGQSRIASELGYSSGAISQVLSGKYQGDLANILARVDEVYGGSTIDCPGLGYEIPLSTCAHWRQKAKVFAATNPQRVMMFKACKICQRR